MKRISLVVFIVLFWSVSLVFAADSPIGKWKTVDDETKKEKSIIEVYEVNGTIYGKIIQLLQEKDGGAGKLCTKCTGSDLNKPVLGMVIVKDLKKDGDIYAGGTIMDPNNGKTYKCKVEVTEGGNTLKVRGFIGLSLMGRTQVWQRVK
jgi:uncharacterized protein (DUF2147 family)